MHNATERHTAIFADYLLKKAAPEGGRQPQDDDEEKSTVGVNPNQYEDPEGREAEAGTIDAPWGESSKDDNKVEHYSDAAYSQYIASRQQMLDELFDSKGPAATVDQAVMGQYLDHASSGDYESRAPLLEQKADDPVKAAFARGIVD